jgi:hypothetical protein
MTGELADEHYEASMVLEPKAEIVGQHQLAHTIESMDLPTRLLTSRPHKDCLHKPVWTGFIKARTVATTAYPAVNVTVVNIPFEEQIVVDGHLCSSDYVDSEGNCLFDRRQVIAIKDDDKDISTTPPSPKSEEKQTGREPLVEDKKEKECPVCTYMKQGPCRTEFLAWDSCLDRLEKENLEMSVCMNTTMTMMSCMRQHEYYDIMTAGTHEKYAAVAQTEKQIEQNSQQQDQASSNGSD